MEQELQERLASSLLPSLIVFYKNLLSISKQTVLTDHGANTD
jgi:hypothetical protein